MNQASAQHVLFLHGFTSSARSGKAMFLKKQCAALPHVDFTIFDFNPTPKDFEYLTITGMINRLRQHILDRNLDRVTLIASSLGGLVATRYAERFSGIDTMLLLAPALFYHHWGTTKEEIARWKTIRVAPVMHKGFQQEIPLQYAFHDDGLRYAEPIPPATQTTIIHGRQDQTVPVEHSRDYAAAYADRVRLVEIDADHRLTDQDALLWKEASNLLHT
jgi:pimeloyl-ACP methyl ester carboxylesterase